MAAALLIGLVASRVRDRRGFAGWLGWTSLLYGSVVCDWLDGPIARRLGATSSLGALLDLESDSWLTLTAASSAVAWGDLASFCLTAPLARYGFLFAALRNTPYSQIYGDEPPWARQTGIAQMMLFTAAMAPFRRGATQWAVRLATPVIAPLQAIAMWRLYRRLQLRTSS